jgi:hypothetical protein
MVEVSGFPAAEIAGDEDEDFSNEVENSIARGIS